MKVEIALSGTVEVVAGPCADLESIALREWCSNHGNGNRLRVIYFNKDGDRVSRTFEVKEGE